MNGQLRGFHLPYMEQSVGVKTNPNSTCPKILHLLTNSVGILSNQESDPEPTLEPRFWSSSDSIRSRLIESSSTANHRAHSSVAPIVVGPHNFPTLAIDYLFLVFKACLMLDQE